VRERISERRREKERERERKWPQQGSAGEVKVREGGKSVGGQ
jgi:hypothetical protein